MQSQPNIGKNCTTPEIEDIVQRMGPWFQNLHLPDSSQTAPHHPLGDFPSFKWKQIAPCLPSDMTGWSVLDVGCNAGFYCLEFARRNARVLGIDREPHYLNQARWAARQFGLSDKIEFRQMQVYEAARMNETFDLVVFMGLFYHLRYPLLALDGLAQRVRRLMLFQSLTMPDNAEYLRPERELTIDEREPLLEPGWPKMAFFENGFAGDRTNWWAPNHSCIEAVLRTCGLRVTARPGHEMYFCEPNPQQPGCAVSWNREEFEAATGVSAAVRR